jgi:hypothetical protein
VRTVLSFVLAGLASTSALAQDPVERTSLPPGLTGAWYNPAQSGHGVFFEVLDGHRGHATWHTFDHAGRPLTLYAAGPITANRFEATAWAPRGMRFGEFDPATLDLPMWGDLDLVFHGCGQGELIWRSAVLDENGLPFGNGSLPINRLSLPKGLSCGTGEDSVSEPPTLFEGGFIDAEGRVMSDRGFGQVLPIDGPLYAIELELRTLLNPGSFAPPGPDHLRTVYMDGQVMFRFGPAFGTVREMEFGPGTARDVTVALELQPARSQSVGPVPRSRLAGSYRTEWRQEHLAGLITIHSDLDVTISSDGAVSGEGQNGCLLSGQIGSSLPVPGTFEIEIVSPNCAPVGEVFRGVVGLRAHEGREHLILHAASERYQLDLSGYLENRAMPVLWRFDPE